MCVHESVCLCMAVFVSLPLCVCVCLNLSAHWAAGCESDCCDSGLRV